MPPEAVIDLTISVSLVALNAYLRLPPLVRQVCHTYQCACVCADCVKRERSPAAQKIRQPWELDDAA